MPIQKTSSSTPAPAPTDVELGDTAAQRDAATTRITELDDKLGRIDDALKDPQYASKKGELTELKKRFTSERKAEVNKRDTAQKKLDAGFASIEGKGTAKEAASHDYGRLTGIDSQIAGAEAEKSAGIKTFSDATKDYEAAAKKYGILSPQARAAEQKAVSAEKKLEQLDRKLGSLQHAKSAVSGELNAKEQQAFSEAKKAGDASVKDISDFSQLSGASSQRQLAAVGAPVVGVSQKQAVDREVKQLSLATTKGSYRDDGAINASKLMTEQLKVATPEHQLALVKGAAADPNVLPQMTDLAHRSSYAAGPMLDTLKTAQGDAQTELATELAKPMKGMDSEVVKELDKRMKSGDGFEEARALEKGLKAAGKPELAKQVAELSRTRLNELTADFAKKGEAIKGVKGDLARLMAGFGPMLPADKQQAAVEAFKARHQEAFDAYDAAGGKLAHAAKFVMENGSWNEKALDLMPDALATKGGQIEVEKALDDQAKGLKTFLTAGVEAGKDSTKVAKYLPQLVMKSVGESAMVLARQGKPEAAQRMFDRLKNNADLLGMEPKKLDKLTGSFGKIVGAEGKDEILKAAKGFEEDLRAAKPTEGVASALKGIAWGASIANGVNRLRDPDKKDLASTIKGTAEILGPTGEAAASTVEMLANSERALLKAVGESGAAANAKLLGKGLGAVGTGVGAALDAISAIQSFSKGDMVDGGLSTLSAIGGATLAVDAFAVAAGMQVVPVWGQIAGTALVIGATVGKWVWAEHNANKAEKAMEADAKAYLQAGGVSEPVASELSDVKRADGRNPGMMIQQLAKAMGTDPKELFARISKLPPDKISDFVDMAKDLKLDKNGVIEKSSQGATDTPNIETRRERGGDFAKGEHINVKYYPQSQQTAVEWTKKFLQENGV